MKGIYIAKCKCGKSLGCEDKPKKLSITELLKELVMEKKECECDDINQVSSNRCGECHFNEAVDLLNEKIKEILETDKTEKII